MQKEPKDCPPVRVTPTAVRAPKYDVVKPAGWTPPDHTDLVEDHIEHSRLLKVHGVI
jgi:hypothetical protein